MSKTINLKIIGMHCTACAKVIAKTLNKQPGVETADVDYETAVANLSFDEVVTTPEVLSESIKSLGYTLIIPANL